MAAHDVVAETNPGYCAVVLANFVFAYNKQSTARAPLVFAYIALPIALSEELSATFEGCNSRTGLLAWLERSPQVSYQLAFRIKPSRDICISAVRFSCLSNTLLLDESGGLSLCKATPPSNRAVSSATAALARARLLGTWLATAGSPRTVFQSLGVLP